MPEARRRVFLGTADTATCLTGLAEGLRANGCTTTTMVMQPDRYSPELTYDVVRGREILKRYDYRASSRMVGAVARRVDNGLALVLNAAATRAYLQHDVFVFIFEPWAPEALLFPLLKRARKKIIVYYLGSDVRHASAFEQEFGVDTRAWQRDPLDRKLQRVRWAELYADCIYSVPDQAGLQIRPYQHAHLPIRAKLTAHIPAREVPVIVHAPSRTDLKGTSFVIAAVDQLRREGLRFQFEMLTGLPRTTVLRALEKSDILIDELLLHGPGVLSAEAMKAGCAVATRILEPAQKCFQPPVCSVRPETIVAALRKLIGDRDLRIELARRGVEWAEREFDPRRIAARMLEQLDDPGTPDYVPDFYLASYKPPHALSQSSRELSTRVVRRFRPDAERWMVPATKRGVLADPRSERGRRLVDDRRSIQ